MHLILQDGKHIMTTTIIILLCSLLLIAYLFDITSSKTKVPSVILLLLLGWTIKQFTVYINIQVPDFSFVLPVLGTIGLVLIVLEGTLDLELNKSKLSMITKSFLGALIAVLATSMFIAFLFYFFGIFSFRNSLINAIPFCVISSAIAIPSGKNLTLISKEFVIYESSFSDILGVLFFTFISINQTYDFYSFGYFGLQVIIMIVISFISTIGISLLLSKIKNHIKFIPIILIVILIYEISKIYHLPALIFILLFGLFIGNFNKMIHFKWIKLLKPEILDKEVHKFKELAVEVTFLVRVSFFLIFGYLIETSQIINTETLIWSSVIVFFIFLSRIVQLKLSKLPLNPLVFVAPRGLITILLFLSIEPAQRISFVNQSLIIQVIILTSLIMMIGLMITTNNINIEKTK